MLEEAIMSTRTHPVSPLTIPARSGDRSSSARFLSVPGGTIAYEEFGGDGPLVVAVPGIGDLRSEYRFLARALTDRGHHVVLMDLRGHGDSTVAFDDVSVPAIADDIIALVQHLDRGPAVLVGTSYGAAAVADAAARAPQLASGVVTIGPAVRNEPPGLLMRILMFLLFKGPWRVAAWAWYWNTLFPTRKPDDHAEQKAAMKENLRQPGRFAHVWSMMIADRAETEPRLGQVEAPTMVVMGTKDSDFEDPAAEAERVARTMHGRALMIDGAGHYPHVEMPEATLPAIAEFIEEATADE
jgi:pimeloyl-ACP methyl ester carboxylesterase